MKKKGIYQFKSSEKESKEYTLSVLTENKAKISNNVIFVFILYLKLKQVVLKMG